jgi:uncharacterized protein YkwD
VAAALIALLAATTTGPATATVSSGDGSQRGGIALRADWQERMLVRVNAVRAQAGVPPVRMCARLNTSALMHVQDMAGSGVFSHEGRAGDQFWDRMASAGYRMRTSGENIAAGQRAPWEVMKAWRASAAHYAILTNPAFRHVGFAMAVATTGNYRNYWVQDFAAGGRC